MWSEVETNIFRLTCEGIYVAFISVLFFLDRNSFIPFEANNVLMTYAERFPRRIGGYKCLYRMINFMIWSWYHKVRPVV